ncbi:hypothetical protein GCM10010340_10740 [Streptomyces griseoloalbus]|nr:hypothetical protein GCM10010340_10740 [Streptomyces albaduncus]
MHDVAGPHDHQRLGEEAVRAHRVQGRQRTVRAQAHHGTAAQELGGLEAGWHVVAPEVVHQPQRETLSQPRAYRLSGCGITAKILDPRTPRWFYR